MRSPTVGGYAIANYPHLLTLGRQVVEGLQVLQPNGVLAIPYLHDAAKVIHCADNCPTATFASELRIIREQEFGRQKLTLVSVGACLASS